MHLPPASEEPVEHNGPAPAKRVRRKLLWSPTEDERLLAAVGLQGPRDWPGVARRVETRSSNQCRDRWYNYLSPAINKSPWTQAEELRLFLLHTAFGNRWALIADHLGGRTDNTVKNYWNAGMRLRLPALREQLARGLALQRESPETFEQSFDLVDLKLIELIRDQAVAPRPPTEATRKIRKRRRTNKRIISPFAAPPVPALADPRQEFTTEPRTVRSTQASPVHAGCEGEGGYSRVRDEQAQSDAERPVADSKVSGVEFVGSLPTRVSCPPSKLAP